MNSNWKNYSYILEIFHAYIKFLSLVIFVSLVFVCVIGWVIKMELIHQELVAQEKKVFQQMYYLRWVKLSMLVC